ncbi:MAG TPA: universal stress protein [Rhodothermales bacterium]|nr:universal stress protein [Rhodothermales bacterium]
MLRIKKILFPTDFSACAEHAFAHAALLVRHYEAALHVLNVAVPPEGDPDDLKGHLEEMDLDTAPLSDQMQACCGDLEKEVPTTYVREADVSAASGIQRYAREQDIDLIVMGTHGRRGLDHVFIGSIAEEIVRTAPCPVFTIGMEALAKPEQTVQRILVPVDFSEYGGPALAYAKELAAVYQARLDLLHVVEHADLSSAYGTPVRFTLTPAEMQKNSRQALHAIGKQVLGETVPFEVHAVGGNPALDTVDFAARHNSDLIVMATHGRTGIRRMVIGSVTEKVVRMASCPVFTVKSFGKSLLSLNGPAETHTAAS